MIGIDQDKYGVRYKYPTRKCKTCRRYPCFIGIDKCKSNFAAYGCTYYIAPKLCDIV